MSPSSDFTDASHSAAAERFLSWAKDCAVPLPTVAAGPPWGDLRPLGNMVGDAAVVALSEAVHGGAELLKFRNRAFQYLVQEKGFTAIAIESGIVEGRAVYDYVLGGSGTLLTAVAQGFSWTFDQLFENHDLVRWLREYNADPQHTRKVRFYGFDVPGSPGEANANRGLDTALTEALNYLVSVDAAEGDAFHARLDPFIPSIRFDFRRPRDASGYDKLSQGERDSITATIADLVSVLERREAPYQAASSVNDYEWAYRAAIGARDADAWLRRIPTGWQPSNDPVSILDERMRFLSSARDVRDRAQADNLEWIIRQEGPLGRILVFAHRYHLSTKSVKAPGVEQPSQEVMGTYLRRRLGERLVTIGSLIGAGEVECAGLRCGDGITQTLGRLAQESIEGLAGEMGAHQFLLDLRTAPAPVANWLERVHLVGEGRYDALDVPLSGAFDVLFYVDAVTPASCGGPMPRD